MNHILAIIITVGVLIIKAYWDNKNWGKVDHTKGIVLVALILIPVSIHIGYFYPLFIFGLLWNPLINKVRNLPFFYIGNTAVTDITLKFLFGERAGEAFFLVNLLLLISSIV